MNYYNPYFNMMPYTASTPKLGLFSKIFGGNLNIGSILSGTQKTLNIVNQTIPLIKQAGPMLNNAKTMFKVMNEFKKIDTPVQNQSNETINKENNVQPMDATTNITYNENMPTFFV